MSQAETYEYLERFGLERLALDAEVLLDPEVTIRGSDAFHGVLEARADWAAYRLELNGKFASRETTEVLGQAMTVTTVISPEGLRISDDRGGSRTEAYRRFPLDACDRGSVGDELEHHVVQTGSGGCADPASYGASFDEASDDHGTIAEVVRNSQGLPIGVRFGEIRLLRYRFTPPLPAPPASVQAGGGWREPSSWELIDLRTSETVIDSVDEARVASERPRLSVGLRGEERDVGVLPITYVTDDGSEWVTDDQAVGDLRRSCRCGLSVAGGGAEPDDVASAARAAGGDPGGTRDGPGPPGGFLLRDALLVGGRGRRTPHGRRALQRATGAGQGESGRPSASGSGPPGSVAGGEARRPSRRAARPGRGLGPRRRDWPLSGPRGPLRRPGAG